MAFCCRFDSLIRVAGAGTVALLGGGGAAGAVGSPRGRRVEGTGKAREEVERDRQVHEWPAGHIHDMYFDAVAGPGCHPFCSLQWAVVDQEVFPGTATVVRILGDGNISRKDSLDLLDQPVDGMRELLL